MANDNIKIKIDPSNNMSQALTKAELALTQSDYAVTKADYIASKEADINRFTDETTSVQTQLNNLVIASGTSEAETIQARGTFPVLNDRLNDVTSQLAEIPNQVYITEKAQLATGKSAKIIAGVIKNDGSGWKYIVDGTHDKTNLTSINPNGTYDIEIGYGFTAKKVNSIVVTTDETLANYGVTVGASVGIVTSLINACMPFSCEVLGNGTKTKIPSFLNNSTTISKASETLTITHSTATINDVPVVSLVSGNGGFEPRIQSYTPTTILVDAYTDLHGYVNYNGSTWNVFTNNINIPTFSFNTSTGVLTVTHESAPNPYSITVTSRDGTYITCVGGTGSTTFEVIFKDYAGNTILTPDTNMKFYFHQAIKVKSIMPNDMKLCVKRGNVYIPSADLALGGANFWVLGLLEV